MSQGTSIYYPYRTFLGGTGVGLEGPVIPSKEVLGALGMILNKDEESSMMTLMTYED